MSESFNQTRWNCFSSYNAFFNLRWLSSCIFWFKSQQKRDNYMKSVQLGHVRNIYIVNFFICEHLSNRPIDLCFWLNHLLDALLLSTHVLCFFSSFWYVDLQDSMSSSELVPLFTRHISPLQMICCYDTIGFFLILIFK